MPRSRRPLESRSNVAQIEDFALDLAAPQRVLDLHRRHRVRRMSPADCLRTGFRNTKKPHLTVAGKITHRADRLLNRHGPVNPVNVIEVNNICPQRLQVALADRFHVFRPAIGRRGALRSPEIAELAGDDILVTALFDHLADQFFVAAISIGV